MILYFNSMANLQKNTSTRMVELNIQFTYMNIFIFSVGGHPYLT